MDALKKYSIPFKSLSVGKHHFEFTADDRFFSAFEGSEIKGGKVEITVAADKAAALLTLDFTMQGYATVVCDRCLDDCDLPVSFSGRLIIRVSESSEESDGEVMWISPAENEVDLARYIYESIVLSLPYQRVHPDGADGKPTCDPDMLSRFRIVSEEEFDRIIQQPAEQKMEENPQWAKLREIKEQLQK